jgi:hypothetical protein
MAFDAQLMRQINHARKVVAVGVVGGYELDIIDLAGTSAPIRVVYANGKRRIWPNLSKLSAELAAMGVSAFEVRPEGYEPSLVRKPRPDRALALQAATNPKGGDSARRTA